MYINHLSLGVSNNSAQQHIGLTRWPFYQVATLIICASLLGSACGASLTSTTSLTAPSVTPVNLTITGNTSLDLKGQTSQLRALVTLSDGSTEDRTNAAQWSTANPAVATVSSRGVMTAMGDGRTVVTASVQALVATKNVLVDLP